MARVTVEDCIEVVPNRFNLVVLAARRAREIASGAHITLPRDNDKNPVVALREIAEETVSSDHLEEQVIKGMQRVGFIEEAESDLDEESDATYQDMLSPSIASKESDLGEDEDDFDEGDEETGDDDLSDDIIALDKDEE